jgi:hypothetical protein
MVTGDIEEYKNILFTLYNKKPKISDIILHCKIIYDQVHLEAYKKSTLKNYNIDFRSWEDWLGFILTFLNRDDSI